MDSLKFLLPGHLRRFVDRRVASGGYSSVGEYLRELVRLDQRRWLHDQIALHHLGILPESQVPSPLPSRPHCADLSSDSLYLEEDTLPH